MDVSKRFCTAALSAACLTFILGVFFTSSAHAATAKEIDASVDVATERFHTEVKGGKEFLKAAKGVLVFPSVYKAGFVIGGEYGEGALRIGGKTVDYYSTIAGSWGQDEALKKFRAASGWKAGVDGSVALIKVGAGGSIDTTNIKDPIVGFVLDQKGLMANLTLEGSKYTKLKK
jgi:lipid-binding SYLF domain-containing protein